MSQCSNNSVVKLLEMPKCFETCSYKIININFLLVPLVSQFSANYSDVFVLTVHFCDDPVASCLASLYILFSAF